MSLLLEYFNTEPKELYKQSIAQLKLFPDENHRNRSYKKKLRKIKNHKTKIKQSYLKNTK